MQSRTQHGGRFIPGEPLKMFFDSGFLTNSAIARQWFISGNSGFVDARSEYN
ncbi:hypothetical protein [Gloeocapsopsis sp. IPPAS B-1203]|uniref:hypothetical protein n=1 Tax=Gloeocapsopsis sp. IPPAS B-1203 TaxID=2049454 RepID=UPI0025A08AC3|nr:hypothetical protein [Gloeocapsopsis sp. IPPAS B-1203]